MLAVLALSCVPLLSVAQPDQPDILTGPVTHITSDKLDVSGRHISLHSDVRLCTRLTSQSGGVTERCNQQTGIDLQTLFIGERVEVSGNDHPVDHSFGASKITVLPPPGTVSGTAIIDLIPITQPANSTERLVRADGYLLRIAADTKLKLTPPLNSVADLSPNQWIAYSGVQQQDGVIALKSASITPNKVSGREDKLRKKTEYDPSTVPDDAHQSGLSKAFTGTDYKRVPPWPDAAMQARVQRIGNSLVPAYQRALPANDPARINFRFQVVDQKRLADAVYLSSGVIVIPHQVVERMQNDDQLATVLADNIAENIEKDTLRLLPTQVKATAAELAGGIAGAWVPGLGLASQLAGNGATARVMDLQLAQSGRVSLCLLHDAGYDITQAPLAWWLLGGKKDKPLDQIKLPPRAETLYAALGLVWRNPTINSPLSASAATTSVAKSLSSPAPSN